MLSIINHDKKHAYSYHLLSLHLWICLQIFKTYNGLECKSRKSRNTGSNRQIGPWNTEWSKAKANRVLQENALVIANTFFQQHKRRLCTWTSPEGQYQNEIDYILCSQRWRSSMQSAKTDRELTVAQIMNSLLPNSDLSWRKWGKPLDHSGIT